MKRDIKFRAKALDNKQWYEGYLSSPDTLNVPTVVDGVTYYDEVLIDSGTICQFTGLKDENGREICEGDIVTWLINDTYWTAPVEWREGSFWMTTDINRGYLVANDWLRGEYQVIGNIHDNPELLTE